MLPRGAFGKTSLHNKNEMVKSFMVQTGFSIYISKTLQSLPVLRGSAGRQNGRPPAPMAFNYRLQQKMTTLSLPRPPYTATSTPDTRDWWVGDRCVP